MLRAITERISSMKQTHAIDVLYVTLLEVEAQRIFLGSVVQGIQGLGLCFSNWWNMRRTLLFTIASKVAPRILDNYVAVFVIQERSLCVSWVAAETMKGNDEALLGLEGCYLLTCPTATLPPECG